MPVGGRKYAAPKEREAERHMTPETPREQWYALQVRSRWERSASVILSGKGYETLLPTCHSQRRQGRRVREVLAPLFPGYVFCRFDVSNRLPILVTPGVISVVGQGRAPAPVDAAEISSIQALVSRGLPAQSWPYLEVGQRIRIDKGALTGIEGILIGFKGQLRIVVSVTLLRRSVAMQVDRASITPVRTAPDGVPTGLPAYTILQGVTA